MGLTLADRYLVPIMVLCIALGAALIGEGVMMHRALDRAEASANIAHLAVMQERQWRAGAQAIAAGSRDTDDALKRSRDDLAVCVGQFLKVEAALGHGR